MLRTQTKSDRLEFFLAAIAVLVVFLAIIVLTRLVIIPYQLGFVMIGIGIVTACVGLSRLVKKLDARDEDDG